jgi:putative hydrolase of the HAD superfamily
MDLWGTLLPYANETDREQNLTDMAEILGLAPEKFVSDWIESIGDRCLGSLGSLEETVTRFSLAQGVRPTVEAVDQAVRSRLDFSRLTHDRSEPVTAAVDELKRAGLRLAIVSDSTEETVRLWPSTRLSARFEYAVFSFSERRCKPDPQMYRRALDALSLPASQVAYVGDGGSRELTGAEAVGLTAYKYRFPDHQQDAPRFDEDLLWRGTRLRDLRELLALTP